MPLWSRSPSVPRDVLDALHLGRGERLLAFALTAEQSHLVATTHALYVPQRDTHVRIGWEQIDKAGWQREEEVLYVVQPPALGERPRRLQVRVPDPGRLVDVVREQVNSAVVVSRHVPLLRNGSGVRIVARRPPDRSQLLWSVAVDNGVDVGDPRVRSAVETLLSAEQAELGTGF